MIATILLMLCPLAGAGQPPVPLSPADRSRLEQEHLRLDKISQQQYESGDFEAAAATLTKIRGILEQLFPKSKYPQGHPSIATNLTNTALVLQELGQLEKGLDLQLAALEMGRKMYPRDKFPEGHESLATIINNVGMAYDHLGDYQRALTFAEEGLAMRRQIYGNDNSRDAMDAIANSMNNVGAALDVLGIHDQALIHYQQALALRRKLYPPDKFPNGHYELLITLDNITGMLMKADSPKQARRYLDEMLDMCRRMYPKDKFPIGHSSLVDHLNTASHFHGILGDYDKALEFQQQALEMARKIWPASKYPNGHPILALTMGSLGLTHVRVGRSDLAEPLLLESLEMKRRLISASRFPLGDEIFVKKLLNVGMLEASRGNYAKGARYDREALEIFSAQVARRAMASGEADALAFVASQPVVRDRFIDSGVLSGADPAAIYGLVWDSKALVTRILEQRLATIRANAAKQTGTLNDLKAILRQIEQVLKDDQLPIKERDKILTALNDRRDTIEQRLIAAVPLLEQWKKREKLTAADLLASLPPRTAFVDMIAYGNDEYHRDAKQRMTIKNNERYVAFIVAPGSPVRLVVFEDRLRINQAVAQWRADIEGRRESDAAKSLRSLIWQRIAEHIPQDTRTLYLAADRELAQLPWCALPGTKPGEVLLDEFPGGIATVPHGPFLLESLKFGREATSAGTILACGALTYDAATASGTTWPVLKATGEELRAIAVTAGSKPIVTLTTSSAKASTLEQELPKAAFAHFATHGFFAAKELQAERQRERRRLRDWQTGSLSADARLTAGRSPLGFTGLVLSRGEVMTGLSLINLPLENLKLVTLSACETGLGELTAGEGVQGLQRAFHLAGCPNVVASLWNVNDSATAALMAKFYHELWVNKRPPIEALREAQLLIYRRPELIADLAGERGAPKLKEAVKTGEPGASLTGGNAAIEKRKHADTKLWAAFVLSGVGR